MSFCKGITQSGSNADTLLSDAYIKGIRNVPWQDAFQAILKVRPPTKKTPPQNRY
jgi:Glycosyl hydrolase family 92